MHQKEEDVSLMKKIMTKKCGFGTRVEKIRVPDPYKKCGCRTEGESALTKGCILGAVRNKCPGFCK